MLLQLQEAKKKNSQIKSQHDFCLPISKVGKVNSGTKLLEALGDMQSPKVRLTRSLSKKLGESQDSLMVD